jgi:hypothetical protein
MNFFSRFEKQVPSMAEDLAAVETAACMRPEKATTEIESVPESLS